MILHIRRVRVLFLLVAALLLAICTIAFILSGSHLSAVNEKLPTSEKIDEMCTPKRQKCFQVVDRIIPRLSENGEEMVVRRLQSTLPSGDVATEVSVRIKPPKYNTSFFESDTRLWKVFGDEMGQDYLVAMTFLPFVTRVFQIGRRREQKRIAFIGGSGAAMLAHLRTLRDGIEATVVEKERPVVELAKRWFKLENATVINADGVEWMKRADGNSSRYDIIFLDACDRQSAQHCPDARFTKEDNVKNLHQMLNNDSRALVVINFEIYNNRKWEMLQQQMDVLLAVFPHCVTLDFKENGNMVVGCLTRPLPFHKSENLRASLDAGMGFLVEQLSEAGQELQYPRVFKEIGLHSIINGKRETILHPVDKAV